MDAGVTLSKMSVSNTTTHIPKKMAIMVAFAFIYSKRTETGKGALSYPYAFCFMEVEETLRTAIIKKYKKGKLGFKSNLFLGRFSACIIVLDKENTGVHGYLYD